MAGEKGLEGVRFPIFNLLQTMIVVDTLAKDQGQRSLASKVTVETDGQMDRQTEVITLPPMLMQTVTSHCQRA